MNPQREYGLVPLETMKSLSGLDFLTGIASGKFPAPPISQMVDMHLVEVSKGRAVFEGNPSFGHYNPIGSVHGGFAATMLDSCMACAVQSTLDAGMGYTTVEFKITYIRPMLETTGVVRAIGNVINVGRRIGVSEGKLVDAQGKVLAHGTTSCLIFPL